MANSDSYFESIPVQLAFTQQGKTCLPLSFIEALKEADLRISLPTPVNSNRVGVEVSTLSDNIARVDSEGKIYVPGIVKIELQEEIVSLTTTTAPGIPVTMTFLLANVVDLQNTVLNINFQVLPLGSLVSQIGPIISGKTLSYSFYRVPVVAAVAPYPEILIRGSGRAFVLPSPSPQ